MIACRHQMEKPCICTQNPHPRSHSVIPTTCHGFLTFVCVCIFFSIGSRAVHSLQSGRMAARMTLTMVLLMALVLTTGASDPELTSDFFLAEGTNKSTITGDYFTSTMLSNGTGLASPAKYAIKRVNSESFPALTGLGVSTALVEYRPGGINPLHTHPRGTEMLTVLAGELNVGLVDSANKLYTKVLQKLDVFVFPKGVVHYQINLSNDTALAYAAFSSSNPGTISLPGNIFTSGIQDTVLATAFKVNTDIIHQLQAALAA